MCSPLKIIVNKGGIKVKSQNWTIRRTFPTTTKTKLHHLNYIHQKISNFTKPSCTTFFSFSAKFKTMRRLSNKSNEI